MPNKLWTDFISHAKRLAWTAAVVAAGCTSAAPTTQAAPHQATSGAADFFHWQQDNIKAIEADLPAYTASARAAAELHVRQNLPLGLAGDPDFCGEMGGRAGGLMQIQVPRRIKPAEWKGVILLGLNDNRLDQDLPTVKQFKEHGCTIIAFGRPELIKQAQAKGMDFDFLVDTHAGEQGGLFQDASGKWVVSTDAAAAITAGWTWTGEFAAACTRLGKMPTMYKAFAAPGGKERGKKIGTAEFHDVTVPPVPAGQLGKEYLDRIGANVTDLYEHEQANIRQAAQWAATARASGKHVYAFMQGHALNYALVNTPHDPGFFKQVYPGWYDPSDNPKPLPFEAGDVVLCIGNDGGIFRGSAYDNFAENARAKGVKLIWSIATYKPEDAKPIAKGEVLIDQHWKSGDALVDVPGYDIKILPASGVLHEDILWMVEAEVERMVAANPK